MRKIAILLFVALCFAHVSILHSQTHYYVALNGNDKNDGTLSTPFKTIERARDQIRTLRTRQDKSAVTVFFREGVYRFLRPFVLTAEDSGNEGQPVKYCSYKNEKVVFSGSSLFQPQWSKYNETIWVSDVRFPKDQGFTTRNLYVNDNSCPLARYPDLTEGKRPFGGVAADCLSAERVTKWKSPEGAYIHGMQHGKWGSVHYKMLKTKESGVPHLELVSINTSTMYNEAQLDLQDRYVENVFEELDKPKEWFYEKKSEKLYFYPSKGMQQKDTAQYEMPVTANLIELKGSIQKPVRNIVFDGIHFEKTLSTWYLTSEHLPVGDYVIYRGATVYMEGTEFCKIQNCQFRQLGGNGVMMSFYNRNSSVEGCRFEDLQANGIVLVGGRDAMRDSPWCEVTDETHTEDLSTRWGYFLTYKIWKEPVRETFPSTDLTPGPRTENYPRYCLIENNLITRAGELEKQAAGVLLSMCAENRVNHNTIYDLPRAGICINDGSWGGNIIENNDVFHTVLSTADHGPFNSWGRDRHWTMKMHGVVKSGDEHAKERSRLDSYIPTIIRHNRFAHTIDNHSWGIDLDDGSSNFHIYDNLTIGCSVKLREGFYRVVENNIFVGKYPPGKHVCFQDTEDIIRRNIYVDTEADVFFEGIYSKPSQKKEYDYNLYYSLVADSLNAVLTGSVEEGYLPLMSLAQWQSKGNDKHSIIADPLFEDLKSGNFKLKAGSPAYKIGFKEFSLDNFGTFTLELRKEAIEAHKRFDAPIVPLKKAQGIDDTSKIRKWMGAKVKNMTTEGEKSVAGIDDIKGVILTEVPEESILYKYGARTGDVVLKVNGKEVVNIESLNKTIETYSDKLIVWVDGNPPAHQITILNPKKIQ